MKENDSIEKLYSKTFREYKSIPSEADWAVIGSKAAKMNFLKFGFSHFNIYYALVGFVAFSTCTIMGIKTLLPDAGSDLQPVPVNKEKNIIYTDSEDNSTINAVRFESESSGDVVPDEEDNDLQDGNPEENHKQMSSPQETGHNSVAAEKTNGVSTKTTTNKHETETTGSKKPEVGKQQTSGSKNQPTSGDEKAQSEDKTGTIDSEKPELNTDGSSVDTAKRKVIKKVYVVQQDTIFENDTVVKKEKKKRRKN